MLMQPFYTSFCTCVINHFALSVSRLPSFTRHFASCFRKLLFCSFAFHILPIQCGRRLIHFGIAIPAGCWRMLDTCKNKSWTDRCRGAVSWHSSAKT